MNKPTEKVLKEIGELKTIEEKNNRLIKFLIEASELPNHAKAMGG